MSDIKLKPVVRIDGDNVAGITLAGGTITYGRRSPRQADQPAYANFSLLTVDAVPYIGSEWPAFGPGPFGAPSGYVVEYEDTWTGVISRLTVGASVAVTMESESGYGREYVDQWEGAAIPRFTGRVTSLDYQPGSVAVTAVDPTERLGYVADDTPYPEETDVSRVRRLAAVGGLDVEVTGNTTVLLAGDKVNPDDPETVLHAAAGQEITQAARWARAVFTALPDGRVIYKTRDTAPNPYPWHYSSGGTHPLGAVITRYNLIPNPGFYESVDLWNAEPSKRWEKQYQRTGPTGGNYAGGWYGPGDHAEAWTHISQDIQRGAAYTFTIWAYTLATRVDAHTRITWLDKDGITLDALESPSRTLDDLVWTQLYPVTSVCPEGAVAAECRVFFDGQSITTANVAAALFEPSPFDFPYFDGSFPEAQWMGEPNASASEYKSPPWPLPSGRVIEPDLAFRLSLGDVVNTSEVTWVSYDEENNEKMETAKASDAESVAEYGKRMERYGTRLVFATDAQHLADAVVDAYKQPTWVTEAVTVVLTDADGREQLAAGTVSFGDSVQVGDLPNGAPEQELRAEVIGWTDTFEQAGGWLLTYYLAAHHSIQPGTRP